MNLIFLDTDFNNISNPIDDYTSLVWTENWHNVGTFNLVLPPERFQTIRNAKYLYNQETNTCAIITNINYITGDAPSLKIGGKMLESILASRVFDIETKYEDTLGNAVYTALERLTQTGNRKIDKLGISPISAFTNAYEGVAEEGTRLDTWLYEILKPVGMSYRINYNYANNEMVFELVSGLDRTQSQNDNTWAIFSTDFENLTNISYQDISDDYYNFAYVVGKYNGSRIVETIDQTENAPRREIVIKPVISSDEASTVVKYRNLLRQRGIEKLAEYAPVRTVIGDVDTTSALKYGINYSIGDLCDIVIPEILDVPISERITSVDHVYESTGNRIVPRFGEGALNLKEYINREMNK